VTDTQPMIVTRADDAYEAIRAINHATPRGPVPAPVLYDVLGSLKLLGPGLQQALAQLGDALTESLAANRVYEDDGADPATRAAACRAALTAAAGHAAHLGDALEVAQQAIAGQGYHPDPPESRRPRTRLRTDGPGPGRPRPSR
jgi:hypothetical protein